jgi:hypothetical protein
MALEINEIGIRMHVRDGAGGVRGRQEVRQLADAEPLEGAPGGRDAIVEECVRRVLRALKTQQER